MATDRARSPLRRVWIDAQTLLPAKRVLHFKIRDDKSKITETYSDFRLNPMLDDKMLVVPQ